MSQQVPLYFLKMGYEYTISTQ